MSNKMKPAKPNQASAGQSAGVPSRIRSLSLVFICLFAFCFSVLWWVGGDSGAEAQVRLSGYESPAGQLEAQLVFQNTGSRLLGCGWDYEVFAETSTGMTNFSNFVPEQLNLGYRSVHLMCRPGEEIEGQSICLPSETTRWRARVFYKAASTREKAMMLVPAHLFEFPFLKALFRIFPDQNTKWLIATTDVFSVTTSVAR